MQLCDLTPHLANLPQDIAQASLSGLSADSRRIETGWVFFAISGNDADGHDYIEQAIANGAIAIMGERPADAIGPLSVPYIPSDNIRRDFAAACAKFWPKRPAIQAAITGTNGKTSVAEFLRQIWQNSSFSSASLGTLGAITATKDLAPDVPSLTTPGPEDLFATIDQLARGGISCLAIEASSHGIAQDRLTPLSVHVAGFTNLSRDHLDFHGDMESYFACKAKLFTDILPDGAAAVIWHDDPHGEKLVQMLTDRPLVLKTIGWSKQSDLQIIDLTQTNYGYDAKFTFAGKSYHYPLALMGRFQAENALIAALMAHLSGLAAHDSFGALPNLKPIAGRMQPVYGHPQNARILVDYAHTPDALENALRLLRQETTGQLLVLFGCGGDRDKGKRPMMGQVALDLADVVYVTDDNPRSEDPSVIRSEIINGQTDRIIEIGNRKAAIQTAIDALGEHDCLLIAGKGHEATQTMGHETLPFDDAAVARSALTFLSPLPKTKKGAS